MYRRLIFCIAIAVVFGCYAIQRDFAFAQQQGVQSAAKPSETRATLEELPARYLITVSEYRLKDVNPSELSVDSITAAITANKANSVETVMLTAIAGTESMVQFGRSVAVTTSRMIRGDATMRNTEQNEIGTVLKVTASPEGQKVVATISYESSRHVGEGADDSPPDTVTTSINTKQFFDLAQPTLIGASTSGETSFVFLTISLR